MCFGWELQKESPVFHIALRDFLFTTPVSRWRNPRQTNTEMQSCWSTVVFTFLLFSLFCLGVGTLCHQNHGSKVVGVAAFYFTWRKTV